MTKIHLNESIKEWDLEATKFLQKSQPWPKRITEPVLFAGEVYRQPECAALGARDPPQATTTPFKEFRQPVLENTQVLLAGVYHQLL